MVPGGGGVGEVADAIGGAAGLDGGFGGGVPDQHDVADLVGPEVGVPEDQVAGPFLAGADPGAVAGGEPAALRGSGPGQGDSGPGVGGLGEAGAVVGPRPGRTHHVAAAGPAGREPQHHRDPGGGERRQLPAGSGGGVAAAVLWVAVDGAAAVAGGVEEDVVGVPGGPVVGAQSLEDARGAVADAGPGEVVGGGEDAVRVAADVDATV